MSKPRLLICDQEGIRLDLFLAQSLDLSRSRIQKLIIDSLVLVNGEKTKANYLTERDDKISIEIPEPVPTDLIPEKMDLAIAFEDDDLMVIDKPAGMVVHPGAGNWHGTLVNGILHHCRNKLPTIGDTLRPGIVHRIDKNTSGLLVIAKSDLAHHSLSDQFKTHSITRMYIGLAWGKFASGSFLEPIARDPKNRTRMWVSPEGRRAHTDYRCIKTKELNYTNYLSQFEASLLTGRTHQIRVHFAYHGYPLVGDTIYSKTTNLCRDRMQNGMTLLQKREPKLAIALEELYKADRQFLHAAHLGFTHPRHKQELFFKSPLPTDLNSIINLL